MSDYEVGTRVMAVLSVRDGVVWLMGEGEYMGRNTEQAMKTVGFPNPTIKLDNGEIVFGCECWWGPVERCKKKWEGLQYVTVPVQEYRPK